MYIFQDESAGSKWVTISSFLTPLAMSAWVKLSSKLSSSMMICCSSELPTVPQAVTVGSSLTGGYNGTNEIADGYVKIVQGTTANNFSVQIDADGSGRDIFRPYITVNVAGTGNFNSSTNFTF
jgi:hypothetical protein